jgi:hypothetical protein
MGLGLRCCGRAIFISANRNDYQKLDEGEAFPPVGHHIVPSCKFPSSEEPTRNKSRTLARIRSQGMRHTENILAMLNVWHPAGLFKAIQRRILHQPDPPGVDSPFRDPPYGDQEDKQAQIQRGIEYFNHLCWLLFRGKF